MARVRRVAQRIDDPQIEPAERLARSRPACRSGRWSMRHRRSETRAPGCRRAPGGTAAPSIGPPVSRHRDRLAGLELVHVQDRRIVAAGRLDEAIGKARHQHARGRVVGIDVDAGGACAGTARAGRRRRGCGRRAHGCRARRRASSRRRREAARADPARCRSARGLRPDPRRRSTSSEQRRRRFFGLFGSQAPQPVPGRGTPPDEPQPRIVNVRFMRRPLRRAAPLRTI